MKKLLLCSGSRKAPYGDGNWFRVDQDSRCEPDMVVSVVPFPDTLKEMGPWDRIALIHGIEHFHSWDALPLLRAIHGALATDGILFLEQPDISICFARWQETDYRAGVYGDQRYEVPAMQHLYGYTPTELSACLKSVGFKDIRIKPPLFHHPERDFRIEATK